MVNLSKPIEKSSPKLHPELTQQQSTYSYRCWKRKYFDSLKVISSSALSNMVYVVWAVVMLGWVTSMRDDKTWPRATHYFIKRRHWSLFIRRWVLWEWVSFVVHICSSLRLTLHFSDCVLVLFCRRPCCICNKQLLINSAQSITFISCSFCNGNQSQSEWHTYQYETNLF